MIYNYETHAHTINSSLLEIEKGQTSIMPNNNLNLIQIQLMNDMIWGRQKNLLKHNNMRNNMIIMS